MTTSDDTFLTERWWDHQWSFKEAKFWKEENYHSESCAAEPPQMPSEENEETK